MDKIQVFFGDIAMRVLVVILIVAMNHFVLATTAGPADPADTVFTGGNIYTVNEKQPRAEAIAVKAGKIVFVGSAADAKVHVGTRTKVIDLKGATVVPGLTDAHYHLMGVGMREVTLNLEGRPAREKRAIADVLPPELPEDSRPGPWRLKP